MRIGVFHGSPYHLRFYESSLALLAERGHTLVLACPDDRESVKAPPLLRKQRGIESALYPAQRGDGRSSAVRLARTARDALRFLSPELVDAHANRSRAFARLGELLGTDEAAIDALAAALPEPARIEAAKTLADFEEMVPPDDGILSFIATKRLDAAVVVSRFNIGSTQTEVVKAARAAGIPVGMIVYSWDNLTNKGVLHVQPDRLFVWNELQADEAKRLHGVTEHAIVVTGAGRFDDLFARTSFDSREIVERALGLEPGRRLVLYVGSSTFVAPREPEFVDRWLAALRASPDDELASANVVVRPHPGTVKQEAWRRWARDIAADDVAVAGPGFEPELELVDQIAASDAVVGLNTSAELEAAILDKPVLTVAAGELAPGQEGSIHYRYLLADPGRTGAVQASTTLEEHVQQLAAALRHDSLREERRAFLRTFLRPRGLEVPAGPILADEIEALARSGRRRGFLRRR